jgi:hypothetical protein
LCVQAIFYGELQIVTILYHDVERSKIRGRSWVHPLRLIFYRGYPLFLKDYEGKNKVLFFLAFTTENALILTTTGFSAMENSMMTFIIYARSRRDAMHVYALSADRRSFSVLKKILFQLLVFFLSSDFT